MTSSGIRGADVSYHAARAAVIARVAAPADAADIERIYAPIVRETAISFEWEPPSRDELAQRIADTAEAGLPWLIAEIAGATAGYAYASAFRKRAAYAWSAEVSVYVAAEARGRGVGRALYTRLLRVLALQGFCNAYAVATTPNPASERLHEATGFERVGTLQRAGFKFGTWHDIILWSQRLRSDADPRGITPITALQHTEELAAALAIE